LSQLFYYFGNAVYYFVIYKSISLHLQVKKTDKNVFKKKRSWMLSELQSVDGKNTSGVSRGLEVQKKQFGNTVRNKC